MSTTYLLQHTAVQAEFVFAGPSCPGGGGYPKIANKKFYSSFSTLQTVVVCTGLSRELTETLLRSSCPPEVEEEAIASELLVSEVFDVDLSSRIKSRY